MLSALVKWILARRRQNGFHQDAKGGAELAEEVIVRWEDPDGTQPSEWVKSSELDARIAELTEAGAININHG